MTGIEKITEKIIADATAEAKKIIDGAEREVLEIKAKYSAKADLVSRAIKEETERTCSEIIECAKAQATVTRRDTVLRAEADVIDDAFDRALAEILSFSKEKYGTMLAIMLSKLVRECLESSKRYKDAAEQPIEIILNSRDREIYGQALLEELRRLDTVKISAADFDRITVSKITADIKGGVILKCGNIEYNSSLELLFRELRPELEENVYSILFGERN
ncbi:MAG: V-type ATP synthase subunit E [Clostridia bacterium]|nr:V-type ATP synthase subunit E [Clostridia bacterium]